jgi:hypothetical protein
MLQCEGMPFARILARAQTQRRLKCLKTIQAPELLPNPLSGSSGSNATAPSTVSPSTSSARSEDAAGARAATPSTNARSTEATEDAGYPSASGPSSAGDGKEDATSSARDRVFYD